MRRRFSVFLAFATLVALGTSATAAAEEDPNNPNARLQEVDPLPANSALHDVDATRILYTNSDQLRIRIRGTQTDLTILATGAPHGNWYRLTKQGAFWTVGASEAEWDGTAITTHESAVWTVRPDSDWACGTRYVGFENPYSMNEGLVRNLVTKTTTVVFPSSSGRNATCTDVAPNGDAIFEIASVKTLIGKWYAQVHRYRAGALTMLSGP